MTGGSGHAPAASGAHPHLLGCAYCRDAVEGLTAPDRATDALRTRVPNTRALVDRIVAAVRRKARLGRLLPLDDPTGQPRIGETAAARTLRHAAGRVPFGRAGRRLPPDPEHRGHRRDARRHARPATARQAALVRRAVADSAARDLGFAVAAVDLGITAEWERSQPPDRARHSGVEA
ncbi:hypothetical protein [Streptomyces sp. NPDC056337]|uniref:hypothetical protein n=1 Tax=Streptomyces sp. NPDC056337 TaxID=3345787 RepID=UPI0035DE8CAD